MQKQDHALLENVIKLIKTEAYSQNIKLSEMILEGEIFSMIFNDPETGNTEKNLLVKLQNKNTYNSNNNDLYDKFDTISRKINRDSIKNLTCEINLRPLVRAGEYFIDFKANDLFNKDKLISNYYYPS